MRALDSAGVTMPERALEAYQSRARAWAWASAQLMCCGVLA